jgi:hypothetical protein
VQDAADAVRPFASEGRPAVGLAIEGRAPLDQLRDVTWSLAHQQIDGDRVAQTVSRRDGVAGMELRRIVGSDGRRNPTLCVARVAFAWVGLGQDDDVASLRQRQRSAQASDAAANHEEIAAHVHRSMLLGVA